MARYPKPHARILFILAMAASSLHAQSQVDGRIVDIQGLPVPKAMLTLTQELSGASENRTADDTGQFTFPSVAAGPHSLTIKADGFADRTLRIAVHRDHALQLGDLALSVLGVSQSVTVVSASRVEELPQDSPV